MNKAHQDTDLSESLSAIVALVGPLARVRSRMNPHSGRVAEYFQADLALPPLCTTYVLHLRIGSMPLQKYVVEIVLGNFKIGSIRSVNVKEKCRIGRTANISKGAENESKQAAMDSVPGESPKASCSGTSSRNVRIPSRAPYESSGATSAPPSWRTSGRKSRT